MVKSRKVRWLVWGGYVLLWTGLLVMPGPAIERLHGTEVTGTLKHILAKTAHVLGYGLMTVLCGWLHVPSRYRWLLMFFLMGHATLTEMIQYHFPELGRTGKLDDVAFDNFGILLGLLLTWNWWVARDDVEIKS
jgi:VanZ family protein